MFTVFPDLDTNVCSLRCVTVTGLAKGDCESHSHGITERMQVQMFQPSVYSVSDSHDSGSVPEKNKSKALFVPA